MKKHILLTTGIIGLNICSVLGTSNPAARYCEVLGYDYSIETDEAGNEIEICTLPDSSKVDAWDFYRGKVKPEYSYCSKFGYKSTNRIITEDGYSIDCQICSQANMLKSGGQDELTVDELMMINGDLHDNDEENFQFEQYEELGSNALRAGVTLPPSFDMRNYNGNDYVNPIRNQGTCGSCYAFATAACSEIVYNKATGSYGSNRKQFSESFIMWCNTNDGCDGGVTSNAVQSTTKQGICERSYFPFTTTRPSSCTHMNDPFALFNTFKKITCNNVNDIKSAIYQYGAVVARVHASTSAFQNYRSGIFRNSENSCSGPFGHAVTLIGWGKDSQYGDYWILRNSWGTNNFGESGYMKISVSSANVSANTFCLIPDPVYLEAQNIAEVCHIPSDGNVVFIGHNSIKLKKGFTTKKGCVFKAKKQSATIRRSGTDYSTNETKDGAQEFSKAMEEEDELTEQSNCFLSPNPTTGEFTILFDSETEDGNSIVITDVTGKVVYTAENLGNEAEINLSGKAQGVYIVKAIVNGNVQTEKLILK